MALDSTPSQLDLDATLVGMRAGQQIAGRFTLTRMLGRGGMGVVWLARDERLEREVALKFLPEVLMHDRGAMADLRSETRRSLEMTHHHIVRVYDLIEEPPRACIAMEYIAGETLANLKLEQPQRCFEVHQVREWAAQLCEALAYAHSRANVVHRDLKPANLMIDSVGNLRVTDFGIARSLLDSASRISVGAGSGASGGTLVYMCPQQALGERPRVLDDIYSAGATLYDLLTGRPPFYSGEIYAQVRDRVPPSLAERREELGVTGEPIPPEWESALAACLAKDPTARPQNVWELATQLDLRLPPGAPPAATAAPGVVRVAPTPSAASTLPPPPAPTLAAAPATRGPARLIATVVLLLLLVGGGAAAWWQYVEQPRRAQELAALRGRLAAEAQAKAARDAAEAAERQKQVEAEQARLATEAKAAEEKRLADQKRFEEEKRAAEERRQAQLKLQAEKDEQARLEAQAKQPRSVKLESKPTGAEVWLRGKKLGVTPLILTEQEVGPQVYQLKLAGHMPVKVQALVSAEKPLQFTKNLEPYLPEAKDVLKAWHNHVRGMSGNDQIMALQTLETTYNQMGEEDQARAILKEMEDAYEQLGKTSRREVADYLGYAYRDLGMFQAAGDIVRREGQDIDRQVDLPWLAYYMADAGDFVSAVASNKGYAAYGKAQFYANAGEYALARAAVQQMPADLNKDTQLSYIATMEENVEEVIRAAKTNLDVVGGLASIAQAQKARNDPRWQTTADKMWERLEGVKSATKENYYPLISVAGFVRSLRDPQATARFVAETRRLLKGTTGGNYLIPGLIAQAGDAELALQERNKFSSATRKNEFTLAPADFVSAFARAGKFDAALELLPSQDTSAGTIAGYLWKAGRAREAQALIDAIDKPLDRTWAYSSAFYVLAYPNTY